MTANDFRRIALALPGAEEHEHMNHPDFRAEGKIFATLGYPDKSCGMVKLSPEQQHNFSKAEPQVFEPVKGAWGRQGSTRVHLKAAKKETLAKALEIAWQFANEKKAKKSRKGAPTRSKRTTREAKLA